MEEWEVGMGKRVWERGYGKKEGRRGEKMGEESLEKATSGGRKRRRKKD